MITVVHSKVQTQCEYIGRPSPLGNPFAMRSESDRDKVISLYRKWLNNKINQRDSEVIAELKRLKRLALDGDLKLGCWCAPRACHGDIIKALLERSINK